MYSDRRSRDAVNHWQTLSAVNELSISVNHAGIKRSLDFMSKHFAEPIQVKDLQQVSGLSRRGFQKAFARIVGINPGAMLREIRIEHAKRVLCRHDLPLRNLARQCGYRSDNTFCIAFQRAVGMPPKKFQRRHLLNACKHNADFLETQAVAWNVDRKDVAALPH